MSVVYSTGFVASATEPLDVWSADWREIAVAGIAPDEGLRVESASDQLEIPFSGSIGTPRGGTYRLVAGGAPTADQEVTADVEIVGASRAGIMLRMPTDDANSGYFCALQDDGGATYLRIWRRVAGVETQVATATVSGNTGTLVARATGTNPVALTLTRGSDQVTYSDSDAARLQAGTPGLSGVQEGAATAASAWMDDYSVDNLAAAGSRVASVLQQHHAFTRRFR
jgi:hypothetical protein